MSLAAAAPSAAPVSNKRKREPDTMADSFTRGILMKDLKAMQKSPLPFAWVPDDVLIDDNILTWQLWLVGPEGTLLCVATPRPCPRPPAQPAGSPGEQQHLANAHPLTAARAASSRCC